MNRRPLNILVATALLMGLAMARSGIAADLSKDASAQVAKVELKMLEFELDLYEIQSDIWSEVECYFELRQAFSDRKDSARIERELVAVKKRLEAIDDRINDCEDFASAIANALDQLADLARRTRDGKLMERVQDGFAFMDDCSILMQVYRWRIVLLERHIESFLDEIRET